MACATIELAVSLASDIAEANQIAMNNSSIRARVTDWYNHTDVTDIEMLAALSLESCYNSMFTFSDMQDVKNYWFPYEEYYGETSIWDIEAAMADMKYFV